MYLAKWLFCLFVTGGNEEYLVQYYKIQSAPLMKQQSI